MNTDTRLVPRWFRPESRGLSSYHVPPARGFIKLDAMENPYGWPPELVQAWLDTLRSVELNRYPDPGASELSDALRRVMQVPAGMQVVLGNGSDELIQMLALAVAGPDRVVLAPEPTFVMYRMIAQVAGMRYQAVALADDFSLDSGATLAAIETHAPAIVFLAYPNNPTGTLFEARVVEEVIGAAPGLVVVAHAEDGIVEAVEAPDHPFALGVQWHPEELAGGDVRAQRLFDALGLRLQQAPGALYVDFVCLIGGELAARRKQRG